MSLLANAITKQHKTDQFKCAYNLTRHHPKTILLWPQKYSLGKHECRNHFSDYNKKKFSNREKKTSTFDQISQITTVSYLATVFRAGFCITITLPPLYSTGILLSATKMSLFSPNDSMIPEL